MNGTNTTAAQPLDLDKLLPCPFCGGTETFVERLDYSAAYVQCDSRIDEHCACLARGPVGVQDHDGEEIPGAAAAIRAWNNQAALIAQARAAQPDTTASASECKNEACEGGYIYSTTHTLRAPCPDCSGRTANPESATGTTAAHPLDLDRYDIDCDGLPFKDKDGPWAAYDDVVALIAQARASQPESATGTTGAIHSDDDELLELPKQPEDLRARWKCEDCDGRGHDGESHWQGHFQPPEPAKCSACDGSGWVDVVALLPEQVIDAQRKARDYQKKVDWKIIDRRDAEIADLRAQLAAKGQGDAVAKMSTFQVRVDAENLNSGARKFTVRMAPASAQPTDPDLFADEAKRLRRVVRALGMDKEVPEDDASLRECLFSVLGLIARKLEASAQPDRGAAPTDEEIIDVLWDASGRGWKPEPLPKPNDKIGYIYEYRQLIAAFRVLLSRASPASQPVAPETAQGDALHWPHDPTETACSSCGLTMGESRLLHDLKRGEMVAVAPSDATPYGWVQFVDGQQTQNFARDDTELAQMKEIAALFIKDGQTVEYVQVFDRPAVPSDAKGKAVILPLELAQRCLSSMKQAVTFGETGKGRPPSQTCLFEIEELEAILKGQSHIGAKGKADAANAGGLAVWEGPMPESNGRSNFTAVLHRKDSKGFDIFTDGFQFARSEYPDRVRYEADFMRWLIGERDTKPELWDACYDMDKHSGYVPRQSPATSEKGD